LKISSALKVKVPVLFLFLIDHLGMKTYVEMEVLFLYTRNRKNVSREYSAAGA
jgi:hypothetical protein